MYAGGYGSNNPTKTLADRNAFMNTFACLPFDDKASRMCGQERARLHRLGQMIGSLIAAIALAQDLTLVTHNTGEFSRIQNLRLEDWEMTS